LFGSSSNWLQTFLLLLQTSNKTERMNGEVRDGEKVMMGLKKVNALILTGYHRRQFIKKLEKTSYNIPDNEMRNYLTLPYS
jgi:hypothetical protein